MGCLAVCCGIVVAQEDYPQRAQDRIVVEAVLRLEDFDLATSEKAKAAVLRFAQHNVGSDQFFELVRKFPLAETRPHLLELAIKAPTETTGVEATRLLLTQGGGEIIREALQGDVQHAEGLVTALGHTGDPGIVELLLPLLVDENQPVGLRAASARAVGRIRQGEKELLDLARTGSLAEELSFTVANILHVSRDESIRQEAARLLTLPPSANSEPLPPLAELIKLPGDAQRGAEVFRNVGTCANCHTVGGEGKEVGPDLSEIGDKLSREAMFVAILDPSAGISHNYETYQALLDTGTYFSGVKLSETDQSVTLKSAEAIVREIPRDQIEEFFKVKQSLMPADLQKAMTVEQLVDVVEYLTTLKKKDNR